MFELRLYLAQRISAAVMVPLVIGHLVVMVIAIQGGLTSAEILERTQGSVFWLGFYGLFVVAASIHAAIGLRNVANEWLGVRGATLDLLATIVGAAMLIMGGRAVSAVTLG